MSHPYWPFFDLVVRTPRLELRYPTDEQLVEVADLAARGIHPPDVMPFTVPWTDAPSPGLERSTLKHHWGLRAGLTAESWGLAFVTVVDGAIVGMQSIHGKDFAVTKTVETGSWLGMAHQGQGLGKEMRAAVLHLAFAGLGAQVAFSGASVDNEQSMGVSRALGYEDDGFLVVAVRGQAQREIRFRLERERWEERRRDDIVIEGLAPCLPLLGAGGS